MSLNIKLKYSMSNFISKENIEEVSISDIVKIFLLTRFEDYNIQYFLDSIKPNKLSYSALYEVYPEVLCGNDTEEHPYHPKPLDYNDNIIKMDKNKYMIPLICEDKIVLIYLCKTKVNPFCFSDDGNVKLKEIDNVYTEDNRFFLDELSIRNIPYISGNNLHNEIAFL